MRRFAWNAIAIVVITAVASLSGRADTVDWMEHVDGDWDDGTKWTNITSHIYPVVPGSNDAIRIGNISPQGYPPAIITLTSAMFPDGITNASWYVKCLQSNIYNQNTRSSVLEASGTEGAPLAINLKSIFKGNATEIRFRYVNLDLDGATSEPISLNYRWEGAVYSFSATNSNISCGTCPTAKGLYLTAGGTPSAVNCGRMEMWGGSLTMTNAAGDARIYVSGYLLPSENVPDSSRTVLLLNDTLLTANNVSATMDSLFRMDNGGVIATNRISGTLTVDDGAVVDMKGGHFDIGTVSYGAIALGYTGTLMVVNGATGTVGTLAMKDVSTSYDPAVFAVSNGAVTIGNALIGGWSGTRGRYELRVSGGSCRVSGMTDLGYDLVNNRHGCGLLVIDGGTFESGSLNVGAKYGTSAANANGYYYQTGGAATIINDLSLLTLNLYGTRQFVVNSDSTLTLKGSAFTKFGTTDWAADLLTTNNLDFSGTLVFDPVSGVTNQNLLAFGDDLGPLMAEAVVTNFPIGTLDLSGVDGAEQVTVSAAGNFSTNALYVSTLLGVTPANAASVLDSSIVVYYDDLLNYGLLRGTYPLDDGGSLEPFNIIPRGTVITIH